VDTVTIWVYILTPEYDYKIRILVFVTFVDLASDI